MLSLDSQSSLTKDDKSANGHHFSESNQSAFRRISSIKSDQTDKVNDNKTRNGASLSSDEHLTNKNSISNPFLSPLISSSSDFHSHFALLHPFLSQTLSFVPPFPTPSYWHTLPFLHPNLSNLRPPGFLPSPISSLPSLPSSLSLSSSLSSSLQPKASTSANTHNKKPSASSASTSATHYHQYTITNNNVLVPSPATLIDFIRRPTTSNGETANAHSTTNNTKSKNLKKYKCDICSRAFSRSNTLVTHKVRTTANPYPIQFSLF